MKHNKLFMKLYPNILCMSTDKNRAMNREHRNFVYFEKIIVGYLLCIKHLEPSWRTRDEWDLFCATRAESKMGMWVYSSRRAVNSIPAIFRGRIGISHSETSLCTLCSKQPLSTLWIRAVVPGLPTVGSPSFPFICSLHEPRLGLKMTLW